MHARPRSLRSSAGIVLLTALVTFVASLLQGVPRIALLAHRAPSLEGVRTKPDALVSRSVRLRDVHAVKPAVRKTGGLGLGLGLGAMGEARRQSPDVVAPEALAVAPPVVAPVRWVAPGRARAELMVFLN